jgi:hypothetical protein
MANNVDANRFILLRTSNLNNNFYCKTLFRLLLELDNLDLIFYCLVIYYSSKKPTRAFIINALSDWIGDDCILLPIA